MVQKMITALELPEDWFENDDYFKGKGTKKSTDFGKRLAFTRRKKGLLQRQLGALIGVGLGSVGLWESDKCYPDRSTIQKIIKALDVPGDWFEDDDNFKDQEIQLIHKSTDAGGNNRFKRLDLTDLAIREKVLRANNDDDLKNIFATDGIFE